MLTNEMQFIILMLNDRQNKYNTAAGNSGW